MLNFVFKKIYSVVLVFTAMSTVSLYSANQTPDVSPIYDGAALPFRVSIEQGKFDLPIGFHSGVMGVDGDDWLFLAGRTNGMHGFENNSDNFPPQKQNTDVFVVNFRTKKVKKRSLRSSHSGLTQAQIDSLSVTSPQFYQECKTLYITGGYGIDTASGQYGTKDLLTAIDIPGLIKWVLRHPHHKKASKYIRQVSDPLFQVTGGYMTRIENNSTLLVFGQNFTGYYLPGGNGEYTNVVRRFRIVDDGHSLSFKARSSKPEMPDPIYRRRDLNIVPAIKYEDHRWKPYLIAYSGVFTETEGAWTVPVTISPSGRPFMLNPTNPFAFKQGMNNYITASAELFSQEQKDNYTVFFGGISYGYIENGQFETDSEMPFINQVTSVKRDVSGNFFQYIMDTEYPVILSENSNPGNRLLFGAGAVFVPNKRLSTFKNEVIKLDPLLNNNHGSVLLGHIVGGIQSTLPNTHSKSDSAASAYIFDVYLHRQ